MTQETIKAITAVKTELDKALLLQSNIEAVWALEYVAQMALNKAAQIRETLEIEQAKD